MRFLKYWSVLWIGIIVSGFQADGIPLQYAIPFLLILALPFFFDMLEPVDENSHEELNEVEKVKQRYVRGEIHELRLEKELEEAMS